LPLLPVRFHIRVARILSQKSAVKPGGTLTTQRDSYAQIDFTDGSSATMRPIPS
jgi:hypothetical protein